MSKEKAKKRAKVYIRKELETADKIGDLIGNHDEEVVEEVMVEVVEDIVPKIEDPFREQQVYRVLISVGQAIGSEGMVKEGNRLLERWRKENS